VGAAVSGTMAAVAMSADAVATIEGPASASIKMRCRPPNGGVIVGVTSAGSGKCMAC
jgi:hypothetical protein